MLVAEDLSEDVEILKMAFQRVNADVPLHFVRNGAETIAYLMGEGGYADRAAYPIPRVLLLDLKMPLRDGFEVLEWVRLQPGLRRLTCVVFSSSSMPEDVNRAFDLGANSFVVKPTDFSELLETVRCLVSYWFMLNRSPDYLDSGSARRRAVRVLLRNTKTWEYFGGCGAWTDDPKRALNFEVSERAAPVWKWGLSASIWWWKRRVWLRV